MHSVLTLVVTATMASPLTIERADFVAAPGVAAPVVTPESWSPVSLPDRWRERCPATAGPGWYRFAIRSDAPTTELWAIYVPDVNMNAAVFLNNALVGVEGAMIGNLGNNWNRPLFFTFPGTLLRPGPNEVLVKVQARAYAFGGISQILVGPARLLSARFERRRFLAVSVAEIAAYVAGMLGLWAAGIWLGAREESMYGWFALSMLGFVVASLNFYVRDIPVPRGVWEWLVNVAPSGFGVAALAFVHRLVGLQRPRVERLCTWALAIGAFLMAVAPARWFYEMANATYTVGVAAAALCAWAVFHNLAKLSRFEASSVLVASAASTFFGIHDVLVQVRVLPMESAHLLPHAGTACALILGSVVISRFVRALEAGKRHNADLTRAVHEREAELASQFARIRSFERQQLLRLERERLMREVHDGLGGHLASTLAMAEAPSFCRQDVVESLRLIAEELSLLVDALDPTLDDLPSLLAILRGRIEPRLVRSGLRFELRVSDVAFERKLQPDDLHHLMRILQEAIANVVKHAGAQTIIVRTAIEEGRLVLEIRDDGVGFTAPRARGRGLTNMQHRARQLGGELTVTATSPGTVVLLRLPRPLDLA